VSKNVQADDAVWATGEELGSTDREQTEQIAVVIGEVFLIRRQMCRWTGR
jgi:hypothetical protein